MFFLSMSHRRPLKPCFCSRNLLGTHRGVLALSEENNSFQHSDGADYFNERKDVISLVMQVACSDECALVLWPQPCPNTLSTTFPRRI